MGFHVKYPKPRRAKGTRFFKIRNYLALGTLAVCSGIGFLIHISPMGQHFYDLCKSERFKVGEIDQEHRRMMNFGLASKTAKEIIENQEEQAKYIGSVLKRT